MKKNLLNILLSTALVVSFMNANCKTHALDVFDIRGEWKISLTSTDSTITLTFEGSLDQGNVYNAYYGPEYENTYQVSDEEVYFTYGAPIWGDVYYQFRGYFSDRNKMEGNVVLSTCSGKYTYDWVGIR
jgi:hypothetical protein